MQEGGVETLIEILCDTTVGEKVRGEVAGVIAQITSPCLENYQQMSDLVDNLEDLLRALLGIFILQSNFTRSNSDGSNTWDFSNTIQSTKLLYYIINRNNL